MANANLDFSGLTVTRTFTFPDATGTIALDSGSTNIITVGTITTGTWHGTKIGLAYGGTNADLSGTGGTSQVLQQSTSGAAITVGQLASTDLSDVASLATTTNVSDAVANLYGNPALVTLDHTLGGTFTAGLGLPSVIFVTSDNAGTIATTTIGATDGDLSSGWELVVTFIVASTTVVHGANFSATGALALPTTATAGQSFRYIWDNVAVKYKRFA